ncbi:hypothetical protein LINPERHAP1_LOCUS15674, partial [Linum perenne]
KKLRKKIAGGVHGVQRCTACRVHGVHLGAEIFFASSWTARAPTVHGARRAACTACIGARRAPPQPKIKFSSPRKTTKPPSNQPKTDPELHNFNTYETTKDTTTTQGP